MTADEALEHAHRAAERDELYYTVHANQRIDQRICTRADARNAVLTADVAVRSDHAPNKWVLAGGCDLDGDARRLVVAIDEDDGTVTVDVVTVYP